MAVRTYRRGSGGMADWATYHGAGSRAVEIASGPSTISVSLMPSLVLGGPDEDYSLRARHRSSVRHSLQNVS